MSLFDVVFRALNKAGNDFVEVRREDGHGSTSANPTHVDIEADILPVGTDITGTERAIVTHSVIQGFSTGQGGGYHDVKVTPSGALTVEAQLTAPVTVQGAVTVDGIVLVGNFPAEYPLPTAQVDQLKPLAVQPVSGSVSVSNFPTAVNSQDAYSAQEDLDDQAGNGGVLTFTFTAPVQLVYVYARSSLGLSQARASTGTPTDSRGMVCDDGVPTAIPVTTGVMRVFAPTGMTVSVSGFRY
jgi:hypothetical protein